jgi:hypothetical protein
MLQVRKTTIPRVPDEQRFLVTIDGGVYWIVARYGYAEKINHGADFSRELCKAVGAESSDVVFVVSKTHLVAAANSNVFKKLLCYTDENKYEEDLKIIRDEAAEIDDFLDMYDERQHENFNGVVVSISKGRPIIFVIDNEMSCCEKVGVTRRTHLVESIPRVISCIDKKTSYESCRWPYHT